jgi:hypothetical protein
MPTLQSAIYGIRPDTQQTPWYDEALQKVSPRFGPFAVHGVHLLRTAVEFAASGSDRTASEVEGLPLFVRSGGAGPRHLNPEIRDVTTGNIVAAAYCEYAVGVLAMADGGTAIIQNAGTVQSIGRSQAHFAVPPVHTDRVEGRLRLPAEGEMLLSAASQVESITVGWTRKGRDITVPFEPHMQLSVRQHANDPTYTSPLVSVEARAVVDGDRGFIQADVTDVLYDLPHVRAHAPVELMRYIGDAAALATIPWNAA